MKQTLVLILMLKALSSAQKFCSGNSLKQIRMYHLTLSHGHWPYILIWVAYSQKIMKRAYNNKKSPLFLDIRTNIASRYLQLVLVQFCICKDRWELLGSQSSVLLIPISHVFNALDNSRSNATDEVRLHFGHFFVSSELSQYIL